MRDGQIALGLDVERIGVGELAAEGQPSPVRLQGMLRVFPLQLHVAERRAIFGAKRDRLAAFLTKHGYDVSGSQGAIYLWVKVPRQQDSESFCARLLEHGIIVSPGESFGAGGEGYIRLALVPNLAEIEQAIAVWERISF